MSETTIFVAVALAGVAFFVRFLVALCRESRTATCHIVNLSDGTLRRSTGSVVLRMPLRSASTVEPENAPLCRGQFGGWRA